jgi:glutamine synthetase
MSCSTATGVTLGADDGSDNHHRRRTTVNSTAAAPPPESAEGASFIEQHGLWDDRQREAAAEVRARVEELGLRQIRVSWGDQHGIARGKTLSVPAFLDAMQEGKDFQFVTAIFDTTNHPVVAPFAADSFPSVPELDGLPDGVLVPDPTTFRVLPWLGKTGWILSDA